MISALASLGKLLVIDLATTGARALVRVVRKKVDEPAAETEPSQPLSYKDVERQQAQIRSATAFKVRKP